jgi:hypothetical protein
MLDRSLCFLDVISVIVDGLVLLFRVEETAVLCNHRFALSSSSAGMYVDHSM